MRSTPGYLAGVSAISSLEQTHANAPCNASTGARPQCPFLSASAIGNYLQASSAQSEASQGRPKDADSCTGTVAPSYPDQRAHQCSPCTHQHQLRNEPEHGRGYFPRWTHVCTFINNAHLEPTKGASNKRSGSSRMPAMYIRRRPKHTRTRSPICMI